MKSFFASISAFALAPVLTLALVPATFAHEGHDDAEPAAAPAQTGETNARAATATDLFELVAVVVDDRLMLYLDRFETNEPISGARIEVLDGDRKLGVEELEPGVYAVVGQAFDDRRPRALAIDVQAGAEFDLLSIALEAGAPPGSADATNAMEAKRGWSHPLVWSASGAAFLAGAGVVAFRRKGARTNSDGESAR